ncbi:MAG TPA: hypothetical protein VJO35_18710 [Terriglobales bacterium]|nr:hypothetical protein [Terriglobales bacterium]
MKTVVQTFVALSLLSLATLPASLGSANPQLNGRNRNVIEMADGPVPWPTTPSGKSATGLTANQATVQMADGPVPWPTGGQGGHFSLA